MTRTIGIVLFPDFEDLDAIAQGSPHHDGQGKRRRWEVVLISEDGKPVTSFLGTGYLVDHSYESCPRLDVILVPGAWAQGADEQPEAHRIRHAPGPAGHVGHFRLHRRTRAPPRRLPRGKARDHPLGFDTELQNLGGDTTVVTDQRWVHDGK